MKKILLFVLNALLLFTMIPLVSHANNGEGKTYEIALVIDVSGSMNQADPQRISIEAAKAFAYYHPSQAQSFNISVVLYNTDVITAVKSADVCSEAGMDNYQSALDTIGKLGNGEVYREFTCWAKDTDIGSAMVQAQGILSGSSAEKKAVLLFTDGKIDLDNDFSVTTASEQRSEDDAFRCAEDFAQNGIPIYTVGLNHNNGVDKDFMQKLADITGGKFRYCTGADELMEFFQDMYTYFVGGTVINGSDIQVEANVESEYRVNIYGQAISEANLVLFSSSEIKTYTVKNPNGTVIAERKADGTEYTSKGCIVDRNNYTVNVKLITPSDGYWTICFSSATNGIVRVGEIYLYNLMITDDSPKSVSVGDTVEFSPVLFNEDMDSRVTTKAIYESSTCTVTVSKNGTNDIYTAKLNAAGNGYDLSIPFQLPGDYEIIYRIVNDQFEVETVKMLSVLPPRLELSTDQPYVQQGDEVRIICQFQNAATAQPMTVPEYLFGFDLTVEIDLNGENISVLPVKYTSDGEISFTYTPEKPGEYRISAVISRYGDSITAGTAAEFSVWIPELEMSVDKSELRLGEELAISVWLQNPANGDAVPFSRYLSGALLEAEIKRDDDTVEKIPVTVSDDTQNIQIPFVPDTVGSFTICVTVQGKSEYAIKELHFSVEPSAIFADHELSDIVEKVIWGKVVKKIELDSLFIDSDGDRLIINAESDTDDITVDTENGTLLLIAKGGADGIITLMVSDGRGAEYTTSFRVTVQSTLPIIIGIVVALFLTGISIPIVRMILKKRCVIRIKFRIKLSVNGDSAVYEIKKASIIRDAKPVMTVREILTKSSLCTRIGGDLPQESADEFIHQHCDKITVTGFPFKDGIRIILSNGQKKVFLKTMVSVPLRIKNSEEDIDARVVFGKITDFNDDFDM